MVRPVDPEAPTAITSFPTDPGAPIIVDFLSTSLQVMITQKDSVPNEAKKISAVDWAVAGVYVLLGPPTAAGRTVRARPGYGADVLNPVRAVTTAPPAGGGAETSG
jgi:hypothetical protein